MNKELIYLYSVNFLSEYCYRSRVKFEEEKFKFYLEFVNDLPTVRSGNTHHIIPRCTAYDPNDLGYDGTIGSGIDFGNYWEWIDTEVNLKKISIRDHFECHKLLSEVIPTHQGWKLAYYSFFEYNSLCLDMTEEYYIEKKELFLKNCHSRESELIAVKKSLDTRRLKYGDVMHKCRSGLTRDIATENMITTMKNKYNGDSMGQVRTPEALLKKGIKQGIPVVKCDRNLTIIAIFYSRREAVRLTGIPSTTLGRIIHSKTLHKGFYYFNCFDKDFTYKNKVTKAEETFSTWAHCLKRAKVRYRPLSEVPDPYEFIKNERRELTTLLT